MATLRWKIKNETGVSELDNRHKQLIDLLNKSNCDLTSDDSNEVCDLTLIELMDYAALHVTAEAQRAASIGNEIPTEYKAVLDHHYRKVQKIQNYYFKAGKFESKRIVSFMNRWITKHLTVTQETCSGPHNENTNCADYLSGGSSQLQELPRASKDWITE